MIATGGLLRINARRQDSLRSKTHKVHTHKRKNKKKRRNEVVVVKGKLKLISVSGLVAVLGIMVLLVGMVMATLGYWPQDGLFFRTRPEEVTTVASLSSSSSIPEPADAQGPENLQECEAKKGGGGRDDGFNQTETLNGTTQVPRGFLEIFLDRYLYSDQLKVFGPLIMGIGIFLFICANAVLHENRDKKTKVINLRDIYSTVIDIHSLHKPSTSSANPLHGLINYIQSKSLEPKTRTYPTSLLNTRGEGRGGAGQGWLLSRQPLTGSREGSGSDGEGGDPVFSIYQEHPDAPHTPFSSSSSHRLSLPPGFSPHIPSHCWTSLQKEVLSSFTLPLCHPRPPPPRRRHSARAGVGWGGEEEHRGEGGCHKQEEEEGVGYRCQSPPLCSSTPPSFRPSLDTCSSSSLHMVASGDSQALLLFSSSSLTTSLLSLSYRTCCLNSSSAMTPPACRRCSLPLSCGVMDYSKGMHSKEAEVTSSHHVTSQCIKVTSDCRCSNRKEVGRKSQVDSGHTQEEEEPTSSCLSD